MPMTTRRRATPRLNALAAATLATLAILLAPAAARAEAKLRLIVFHNLLTSPVYVAADKGFFAAEGLAVEITRTGSSGELMKGLVEGRYDLANASIDNYIAFQEGQTQVATSVKPDLVVVAGGATTTLSLVAAKGIESYADIKGKAVAVDAPDTAFAFVLYKMLEKQGLERGRDYQIKAVGGTDKRFEALGSGDFAATMLTPDFVPRLGPLGARQLETSVAALGPYQGTAYAGTKAWVGANRATVVAFLRALSKASTYVIDPANEAEVVKVAQARFQGLSAEDAAKGLAGARRSLKADLAIDQKGLSTVLALRAQYGEPRREIGDPGKYIDPSFLAEARR